MATNFYINSCYTPWCILQCLVFDIVETSNDTKRIVFNKERNIKPKAMK